VVPNAEGCVWEIEFEDGTLSNKTIPKHYLGSKECSYTTSSISYEHDDAYDIGVFKMLNSIDFDKDGAVLFNLDIEDLEIIVNIVTGIPYMWGPSMIEVRMWQ
jgi:hypothetical protein